MSRPPATGAGGQAVVRARHEGVASTPIGVATGAPRGEAGAGRGRAGRGARRGTGTMASPGQAASWAVGSLDRRRSGRTDRRAGIATSARARACAGSTRQRTRTAKRVLPLRRGAERVRRGWPRRWSRINLPRERGATRGRAAGAGTWRSRFEDVESERLDRAADPGFLRSGERESLVVLAGPAEALRGGGGVAEAAWHPAGTGGRLPDPPPADRLPEGLLFPGGLAVRGWAER